MNSPEPNFDIARGDAAVSRQLADALRILRDNSTDPALKDQVKAVLSGQIGPRDLLRTEAFNQTLDRVLPDALRRFDEMSDEERERLAAQGEAELERYRQEINRPAPAAPPTESPASRPGEPHPTGQPPTAQNAPGNHLIPGTRKPNRDRVVAPDEPDEDDLYFDERNRRGWLE
ncbi:hypothetical protein IU485_08940 [Nocardia cyriacigeorgica]|uniref:hypothetical protein n=1 Tax=Nocardia cyriacigeorgica TaxID=135487 RepID=UPI001896147E|nr:hypothetical protein [Nocardia cyriacigeorgica]MBF6081480.1 hypothetical protein [Nocardia cyriacigeorgica]